MILSSEKSTNKHVSVFLEYFLFRYEFFCPFSLYKHCRCSFDRHLLEQNLLLVDGRPCVTIYSSPPLCVLLIPSPPPPDMNDGHFFLRSSGISVFMRHILVYAVQERSDETFRERKSLFLTPWRAKARLAQVPWGGEVFRGLLLSQSWPPLFLFHRRLGARWIEREGPSSIVMGLAAEVPRGSLTFRVKRVFWFVAPSAAAWEQVFRP